MRFQRILVLAPHTDDSELGSGGTIARMIEAGSQVFVAAFSIAEDSLPPELPRDTLKRELFEALAVLGVATENIFVYEYPVRKLSYHRQEVLEDLVKLRGQTAPDLILLPSANDTHQDHQIIHAEGVRAFKDLSILAYELPWNHIQFSTEGFVALESHHVRRKWQALQMYRSQVQLNRVYFSQEFIEGLARVRGAQVKTEWAEAFEVIRIKW